MAQNVKLHSRPTQPGGVLLKRLTQAKKSAILDHAQFHSLALWALAREAKPRVRRRWSRRPGSRQRPPPKAYEPVETGRSAAR